MRLVEEKGFLSVVKRLLESLGAPLEDLSGEWLEAYSEGFRVAVFSEFKNGVADKAQVFGGA